MNERDIHPDVNYYLDGLFDPQSPINGNGEIPRPVSRLTRQFVETSDGNITRRHDHATSWIETSDDSLDSHSSGRGRRETLERILDGEASEIISGNQEDIFPVDFMTLETNGHADIDWSAIPPISQTTIGEIIQAKQQ